MCRNGMHDHGRFSVTFGKIGTNGRMGAFHFVVHGFANVMQKAGAFRLLFVQAEFRRHDAAQEANFEGMLQNVLGIACAIFEFTQELDQIRMYAVNSNIEGRLFPSFADGIVDLGVDLLHNLLNACGMNPPVGYQAFKRDSGNFAPNGIETREDHRLRSIINDQIDPRRCLDGSDIPAFATDDPPLHLLIGQGYHRHRLLRHIVASIALNGQRNNILGLAIG